MRHLLLVLGLALGMSLPAWAQYKWVDADGKVHYSDKPPPGNTTTQKLRPPPPAPVAPAPKDGKKTAGAPQSAAEQEQAFRKRQTEATKSSEEQEKKDKEARDRAENCSRAKAAVASLEIGGRQTRIDDKGERVFLSDQEITQALARARQDAAAACN